MTRAPVDHFCNVVTPSKLGLELQAGPDEQAWYLIESDEPDDTARDVCDALVGVEIEHFRLPAARPEQLLRAPLTSGSVCVVTASPDWDSVAYSRLDRMRERIRQAYPLLLWVALPVDVRQIVRLAPNFAAFFQPSAGRWSRGTMAETDAEAHLASLRVLYGRSDDEVIALATRGELPGDADHHLWLILLNRGDLIPGSGSRTR